MMFADREKKLSLLFQLLNYFVALLGLSTGGMDPRVVAMRVENTAEAVGGKGGKVGGEAQANEGL